MRLITSSSTGVRCVCFNVPSGAMIIRINNSVTDSSTRYFSYPTTATSLPLLNCVCLPADIQTKYQLL
ncbi:MAG: hypothetical protein IPL04_09075 [Chitinophagaceae bacterium]|nr:hypothetical protein [Chitinophagaceae bacterium]